MWNFPRIPDNRYDPQTIAASIAFAGEEAAD
jgi:hypothetical protein